MTRLPAPPAEAMPVIRLIRKLTKRPDILPTPLTVRLRFPGGECPLGLLPGARDYTPTDPCTAGLLPMAHGLKAWRELAGPVAKFWRWWDSLRAPTPELQRLAVDLVWGRGRRAR